MTKLSASDEHEEPVSLSAPKKGLLRRSEAFLKNTAKNFSSKGFQDEMEEFTREMTLVVEGLGEDQARLEESLRKLSDENGLIKNEAERTRIFYAQEIDSLHKRLSNLEKMDKLRKTGLNRALNQVMLIVAIIAVAWVLVTAMRVFGGS